MMCRGRSRCGEWARSTPGQMLVTPRSAHLAHDVIVLQGPEVSSGVILVVVALHTVLEVVGSNGLPRGGGRQRGAVGAGA
jgi:hypothetical protein